MNLEILMIKYKICVNYLQDQVFSPSGWHASIRPYKLRNDVDPQVIIHTHGHETPLQAVNDIVKKYKEKFPDVE